MWKFANHGGLARVAQYVFQSFLAALAEEASSLFWVRTGCCVIRLHGTIFAVARPRPHRRRTSKKSAYAGPTIAAFTIVLSSRRIGYVLDGISWVMKTTHTSSIGSTQNAVDAMPPHENSPRDAVTP